MTQRRFILMGAALVLFAALQTRTQSTQTPSVQQFYETLVAHYDPSSVPTLSTVESVTNQIAGARPEEITKALPAIFAALGHQEKIVKDYALTALYMIALRPDSTMLLKSRVDTIGNVLLTSQIPETRAGAIVVLSTLKPSPPPEVVPIFLSFLKQTTPDAQAQASGVIFALVRIAPENPAVIAAIREFLSRPLDSKTKRETLVAVGMPTVKDAQIISTIITSMDDPDVEIRITAIQALAQMGPQALQQAEPTLQKLANDSKQPSEIISAAKEALQRLHPSTKN